jgi:tRNA dimethylallyltransferase
MSIKTCIIICGPTASGKTAVAIELAQFLNTQIISADSRQCFTELGIAVAKPSPEELKKVPHHFINTHSIFNDFSAADYEKFALQKVSEIFRQHDYAVMVGGTGLYLKAFADGLDDIKPIPSDIKAEIDCQYKAHGIAWLQTTIAQEDKLFFENGEIQNPHRLIRALEVMRGTGKSILAHQQKTKKTRDFNIVKIGIDIERNELYNNINNRVDAMLQNGLVHEAKNLYQYKHLNALQTVGYRELFDAFENKITTEKAIELIKQNTRHYAKRQLTWFKKDTEVQWLKAGNVQRTVKNMLHSLK